MINFFNFKKVNTDTYLITNDFGEYAFISSTDLYLLATKQGKGAEKEDELRDKWFILPDTAKEIVPTEAKIDYRTSKAHLFSATALHIFVLTNQCNAHCRYCQAQDESSTKHGMMTKEAAQRAVDIALSSPERFLSFEFQGGEPLLNFETLQFIVEYAEQNKKTKVITYSVVSNLALLTKEKLDWLNEHNVSISTSLDGSREVQEANRPLNNGHSSYDAFKTGYQLIKKSGRAAGAIQTTTRISLNKAKQIVDEYVTNGFDNIFIRPLTPLGYAKTQWHDIGYTPEEFGAFYKEVLGYVLELNKQGVTISEGHASIILPKILAGRGLNYMELRSPCGATCGQMAYYYDGRVFTCDEGRMLAEMGNPAFKLGDVFNSTYDDLLDSPVCRAALDASILESLPGCCDCVYQPYCGTCPVINLADGGNIMPMRANNYRCQVYKAIFDSIFEVLYRNDEEEINILRKWIN